MTIVEKFITESFDDVNFELEALLNRIETLEDNMNKALAALPDPVKIQTILDDFQGQVTAAVQNAQQGQKGLETRMSDLEVSQTAVKGQIVDTAIALQKAPQDVLAQVIAAASDDAKLP